MNIFYSPDKPMAFINFCCTIQSLSKKNLAIKKMKLKAYQREGAFKWVSYPMQIAVGTTRLESSYYIYKYIYLLLNISQAVLDR